MLPHPLFFIIFTTGCKHPSGIRGLDSGDHYESKGWILINTAGVLIIVMRVSGLKREN